MFAAELVVLENMLGSEQLVAPVRELMGGVLETIDVVSAGPNLKVAKVGAETGFVRDREFSTLFR